MVQTRPLRPFHDARITVRLSDMFLNKVKPTIQRSRDGTLQSYIPWKTSYETGYVLDSWNSAIDQGQLVLDDLRLCAQEYPQEYISIVGVNSANVPVDVFVYHEPGT